MERTLDERRNFFLEIFKEEEIVVFLAKKEELIYIFSTFAWSYTKNTERGDSSPLFLFIENWKKRRK